MNENEKRVENRKRLHSLPRNLSSGRWAVACVGMRGWMQDMAIGDGITSALQSLFTRCETREEAEKLAEELNEAEPGVMPGSPSVFVFEAMPYKKTDYIGSQNRDRGQTRDVDRRIFKG